MQHIFYAIKVAQHLNFGAQIYLNSWHRNLNNGQKFLLAHCFGRIKKKNLRTWIWTNFRSHFLLAVRFCVLTDCYMELSELENFFVGLSTPVWDSFIQWHLMAYNLRPCVKFFVIQVQKKVTVRQDIETAAKVSTCLKLIIRLHCLNWIGSLKL